MVFLLNDKTPGQKTYARSIGLPFWGVVDLVVC
jgi:hypothetical protein